MVKILGYTEGRIIAAKASKKLNESDYYKLLPLFVNRLKQYPSIRLYLEISDLVELEPKELQEEVGFNAELANAFDKVAIIGENKEKQLIKNLTKPFISAEVRCYNIVDKDEAMEWLKVNTGNLTLEAI